MDLSGTNIRSQADTCAKTRFDDPLTRRVGRCGSFFVSFGDGRLMGPVINAPRDQLEWRTVLFGIQCVTPYPETGLRLAHDARPYNPPMVGSPGQTVATSPLLETKLYIPKLRPSLVPRPRLIERLDQADSRLILVSAPAGFGKTTVLAEWLATADGDWPAAWLSLDQSDNDPALFWAYCIAALQTLQAGVGASALSLLQSPQPPSIEALLGTLIKEIGAIGHRFALVLDDYHLIDAQSVHDGIAFLLDHLPPQMHLVIATRADPPLPLSRLRVRRELAELRAADLRFTNSEAAAFLNEVVGLGLAAGDVAALEARTEGWIAGLQLAALSMQDRDDVAGFISAFTGDDRYVVDYLVEEVLQRQPEHVRSFLLRTSVLDRLSGPLCDAVTGQESSKGMLEALERGNLFVVPLDGKRQWYRYHHLFADVLRARSMEQQPDRVPTLHRRASEWYERNGLPSDAIHHALAAADFERAADLIELAWNALQGTRVHATWLGWSQALPDEVIRARPVLSVGYAWTLMIGGKIEAGVARLRDAERWLDAMADGGERPAGMVVVNEEEFRSLPGIVAGTRSFHAQVIGDVAATVEYAQRALELLPEDNSVQRAIAGGILGLARWSDGELETAYRLLEESAEQIRTTGDAAIAISGTDIRADLRLTQGRLHEAFRIYETALQLATEQDGPVVQGTADLYLGLSELHLERSDLDSAAELLQRSEDLGKEAAFEVYEYRSRVAKARMKEARGDLQGAVDLLDDAERINTGGPAPDLRPEAARRTRVWLAQGRLSEALNWARERDLSAAVDLSYLHEFEHITLARVLNRPLQDRTGRAPHPRGGGTAGAPPARRGGRRKDGKPDRDPRGPGARAPGPRRHPRRAPAARARADFGRARGVRAGFRGRRRAHARPPAPRRRRRRRE